MLITLSGLDGAGKSTLIRRLSSELEASGRRTVLLTMYDDIALYSIARRLRHAVGGQAHPDQHPEDPRTDQRSGTAYRVARMPFVRRLSFIGDLIVLLGHRFWHELLWCRVIILDRYVYDSLADVADGRRWGYVRSWMRVVPTPDVPVLVDVDPDVAFERKQEYSPAYLAWRRTVYLWIFARVPRAVIIRNDDLDRASAELIATVLRRLS